MRGPLGGRRRRRSRAIDPNRSAVHLLCSPTNEGESQRSPRADSIRMNHAPGAPLTTPAGVMAPPSGASAGTRLVPSLSTARMGTMVEARALEEKARTAGRRQDWRKDCILGARSRVRGGATNPRRPLSTFDPTSLLLLPAGGNGWVQVLNSPNWALVLGGNSETDRRQLAWTPSRCALASYRRYLLSRSHVRTRGTRLEKNRRISAVRCTLRGIRRSSLPTARAGTPSWVRPPPPDDSADMPWTCRATL